MDKKKESYSREIILELLISRHERRPSQLEALNEMPLYPTEDIIWDENIVPMEYFSGEGCLALPKLHLQFLTLHDYLLRNFNLFRWAENLSDLLISCNDLCSDWTKTSFIFGVTKLYLLSFYLNNIWQLGWSRPMKFGRTLRMRSAGWSRGEQKTEAVTSEVKKIICQTNTLG